MMTERQEQQHRQHNDDSSWEDIHMKDYDDDDEAEEDEDEDEVRDEDEEEDSSLWNELASGWKQHVFAIFVAILATAVAYSYQSQLPSSLMMPTTSPLSSSSSEQLLYKKHAHLERYQRTANISFCGHGIVVSDADLTSIPTPIIHTATFDSPEMVTMDFNIPKKLLPTLAMHYAADVLQDDDNDYTLMSIHVLENSHEILVKNHHAEYACLQQQKETSSKPYVKGVTMYYKSPDIASMYQVDINRIEDLSVKRKASTIQPAELSFTGFAAKFINLSPKPVLLHWEKQNAKSRLVGEIPPFESIGTATTPGQSFSVSPVYDSAHALARWVATPDDAVLTYSSDFNITKLAPQELAHYQMQLLNAEFAKHYLIHSGRIWLAHFPRAFPIHPIWEASYFGQQHSVAAVDTETGENNVYKLNVVSVTPRVFTIPNFLSAQECQQLIELAQMQGLKGSTVFSGGNMTMNRQREGSTRSSSNAWLARSSMNVTDKIYRRAAALLKIDESLLHAPMGDDVHAHHHATAESLQIVNYKVGQEYTAHHDFIYPPINHRLQPTRFATLLFYLNDDFEGGHTVFPRAVNAHHHEGISVQPVRGMAVLFYNMLPDGNVDDLSQHSSTPVESGEKNIANLWIWDAAIN